MSHFANITVKKEPVYILPPLPPVNEKPDLNFLLDPSTSKNVCIFILFQMLPKEQQQKLIQLKKTNANNPAVVLMNKTKDVFNKLQQYMQLVVKKVTTDHQYKQNANIYYACEASTIQQISPSGTVVMKKNTIAAARRYEQFKFFKKCVWNTNDQITLSIKDPNQLSYIQDVILVLNYMYILEKKLLQFLLENHVSFKELMNLYMNSQTSLVDTALQKMSEWIEQIELGKLFVRSLMHVLE
jgi:hypothetical protein